MFKKIISYIKEFLTMKRTTLCRHHKQIYILNTIYCRTCNYKIREE